MDLLLKYVETDPKACKSIAVSRLHALIVHHPDAPSMFTATPSRSFRQCILDRLSDVVDPVEIKQAFYYLNRVALAAMTIISHHFDVANVYRDHDDTKNGVSLRYRSRVNWKTQLQIRNSGLLRSNVHCPVPDIDQQVLDGMDPIQHTRCYVQKHIIDYLQTTRPKPIDYYKS
jgi:hypothetical protein